MNSEKLLSKIFKIDSAKTFEVTALQVFQYQYEQNPVYHKFCNYLNKNVTTVKTIADIPFLPIDFFKSQTIITGILKPKITFTSSGTTGNSTSKHHVSDLTLYEKSYLKAFTQFYGKNTDYCILALLPSYLERQGSSLIYMVEDLIKKSNHPDSGFYLNDLNSLQQKLTRLNAKKTKTLLIGVSFALLDLAEQFPINLEHTTIMETGGMKGRRKEMIREELHATLIAAFKTPKIHSEYGMTELLSQGYSKGDGIFNAPPWMKILTRDTEDPLTVQTIGKTGGINVIDLANINSCSFIATQDLGKVFKDGSFEILGRFDNSDIRGCNLMVL